MTKETKTGVFKKWATVENKPIQEAKKFEFFEDEVLIQIFVKYPSNLTLVGAMNQFFLNKLGPQKDHQRNIYLVPTSQTKCRVNGLV